jgi:phosphoglycolate phosphatase
VRRLLVLWDVDHTLINAGGASSDLCRLVFAELFGRELTELAPMAGRTDRAIAAETLALAGIDQAGQVESFLAALARRAPWLTAQVRRRGRVLPGAAAALAALAAVGSGPDAAGGANPPLLVQSVLTGNMRPLAEAKLGALGLDGALDLNVGAYGDHHAARAELVPVARRSAAAAYGGEFAGTATVLIGDTPLDVEAAAAAGARAVAVATGDCGAAELAAAGADAVLPDLTDTGRVVAAVLGGEPR